MLELIFRSDSLIEIYHVAAVWGQKKTKNPKAVWISFSIAFEHFPGWICLCYKYQGELKHVES